MRGTSSWARTPRPGTPWNELQEDDTEAGPVAAFASSLVKMCQLVAAGCGQDLPQSGAKFSLSEQLALRRALFRWLVNFSPLNFNMKYFLTQQGERSPSGEGRAGLQEPPGT